MGKARLAISVMAGAMVCGSGASWAGVDYPSAHRDKTVDHYFGTAVPAPYQWMEQLDDPALKAWIDAENQLTAQQIKAAGGYDWVHQRLTALENVPSQSVPVMAGPHGQTLFYTRNTGLQDQSVLYKQSGEGKPQALLDPNTLSSDGQIALLDWQPSDDGRYVVYGLSQGGSDWQTLHVLDTQTGQTTDDVIQWVKFSNLAWTADGKGFFYSRYPAPGKGSEIAHKITVQSLYYHRLGTPQKDDALVFTRPKLAEWVVDGSVSDDGRFLYVSLSQGTSPNNRLFVADMGDPNKPDIQAKLKPVFTQNDASYRPIGHVDDTVYLLTTRGAPNGRIVSFDLGKPEQWHVVMPEGDDVIAGATLAGDQLLVQRLVDVKSEVALYSLDGEPKGLLPTPAIGTVGGIHAKTDQNTLYYGFTSFLYPGTIYRYDLAKHEGQVFFQPKIPFDAKGLTTEQVFYRSKDGTKVPMFITHAKDIKLDGHNPTLLYAYGGFDISITPSFSKSVATWLEMGGVYAVANIRGGGEYGESWHHAGMLGNKQNVFDDFAAAARYLADHKYADADHLGIEGYSNGGLLVGASITEHPELFGAAYAGAGVQDMLRYQHFSGGALWAPEYGTSDDKQAFNWLIKFSPLANVDQGTCYPPTILTTADHDDRVVPSHTYKFAAKLQHAQAAAKDCKAPILLRVDTQTSHNYMPTDKRIDRAAAVLTFMADHLGARAPEAKRSKDKPAPTSDKADAQSLPTDTASEQAS